MRPPISFVYGNLVFGATLDDVWAAFSVPSSSYEWCSEETKRARLLSLMGAFEAIEADVQILRVGGRWDLDGYLRELEQMEVAPVQDAELVQDAALVQDAEPNCESAGRHRRASQPEAS